MSHVEIAMAEQVEIGNDERLRVSFRLGSIFEIESELEIELGNPY